MLYEVPELYKALALAYERAKGDESWRVVLERMSYLVSYLEWLSRMGRALDVDVEAQMKGIGAKVLQLAEGGNSAGMLEAFEKVMESARELEGPLRASHSYVTVLRISTSLVVLASSLLLLLWALGQGLVLTASMLSLATGAAVGSLLVFSYGYSHLALSLSVMLQAFSSLTALQYLSWTEISLTALSLLVTLGLVWITYMIRGRLREAVRRLGTEAVMKIAGIEAERSF
ncbi:MAG: hypothetical protein ABDH61_02940 [Acidilobaceae archaeon]